MYSLCHSGTSRDVCWCHCLAQMGRLVFGAEDEKRGYQRYASQALHPKTQVVKGILADECAALMKEFFAAKRK